MSSKISLDEFTNYLLKNDLYRDRILYYECVVDETKNMLIDIEELIEIASELSYHSYINDFTGEVYFTTPSTS